MRKEAGSIYIIVARDKAGNPLVQSRVFQAGGLATDAPVCDIKSTKHSVSPGEIFKIEWNSPHAQSVYKNVGFHDGPQQSLKKNGGMKLKSSIPGVRQYTLVFGANSGNQSACTVFVEVVSDSDQSTKEDLSIDVLPLDTKSLKPTLTGTAREANSIRLTVSPQNEKAGGFVWVSKPVKVKDGRWSVKVGKLPKRDAEYTVEVHVYDNGQYGASQRATLAVQ